MGERTERCGRMDEPQWKRIRVPVAVARQTRRWAIVKRLTVCLPLTYTRCRNDPAQVLTSLGPNGVVGFDNEEHDLVVHKGDIIGNRTSFEGPRCSMSPNTLTSYRVVELLGEGTFGQVLRCVNLETDKEVAVKILKNHTAYFRQGLIEVAVLTIVRTR